MRAHLLPSNLAFAALLASACAANDDISYVTSDLRITGTVTSATPAFPIGDATVILGVGGYFGGSLLDSAKTDEEGRYHIEYAYRRPVGSCKPWVTVNAAGYRPPTDPAGYALHIVPSCTENVQRIDIALDPL